MALSPYQPLVVSCVGLGIFCHPSLLDFIGYYSHCPNFVQTAINIFVQTIQKFYEMCQHCVQAQLDSQCTTGSLSYTAGFQNLHLPIQPIYTADNNSEGSAACQFVLNIKPNMVYFQVFLCTIYVFSFIHGHTCSFSLLQLPFFYIHIKQVIYQWKSYFVLFYAPLCCTPLSHMGHVQFSVSL